MGVDWLSCKKCGETFPGCGDFTSCECGEHWCSDECAEKDGYEREHCKLGKYQNDGYPEEECEFAYAGRCDAWTHECEYWAKTSCKYCRQEDFEDDQLLDYALNLLGMNRDKLIERYKEYTGK